MLNEMTTSQRIALIKSGSQGNKSHFINIQIKIYTHTKRLNTSVQKTLNGVVAAAAATAAE